jgi:hypothetical protein
MEKNYQISDILSADQVLFYSTFFLADSKVLSKESISIQLNTSIRKWQSDLEHSHKIISGTALKPGRLIWSSV